MIIPKSSCKRWKEMRMILMDRKIYLLKTASILFLILFVFSCSKKTVEELPVITMEIYSSDVGKEQIQFPWEAIEKAGIDFTRGASPAIEITIAPKYYKIFENIKTKSIGHNVVLKSGTETFFSGSVTLAIKDGVMVLYSFPKDDTKNFFDRLGRKPDYSKDFTPEELRAAKDYRKSAENPWFEKAVYAQLDKDYLKAEEYVKKAIESNPNAPSYHIFLATIYRQQGKKELILKELLKAEDIVKKMDARKQPPGVYLGLADTYAESGNYKKAVEYYKKVFDVRGRYPIAQMGLAGVYEKMGEYDLALKEYRSLSELDDENMRSPALDGIKRINEKRKSKLEAGKD
jgi:tetratricopeptide (TPR) repeat protein